MVCDYVYFSSVSMVRASVVVLGDIGRSPRMQYHSVSLAASGHDVDLVGYHGSRPHRMVNENDRITLRYLPEPPLLGWLPVVFGLAFKCVWQAVTLFWGLTVTAPKMDVILLQNPPGLPALFVCWLASWIRNARFIIDWHNYTWSMLAAKWGEKHLLVRLVRWYEYTIGGWADDGFCVTEAMKHDLRKRNEKIQVRTFYDRPLKDIFRPVSLEERHEMMKRMAEYEPDVFAPNGATVGDVTRFTELSNDGIHFLRGRPALLVSSTSWSADEDFGLLFDALSRYDHKCGTDRSLPEIVFVVTGKGPLKEFYLSRLPDWNHIQLCTPWLPAEEYPLLLACADLGVCLHDSTSGLDLPMKAVDMLGCRVPVLALRYECIEELVKPDENGILFDDAGSLADILADVLFGENAENQKLNQLKKRLNQTRDATGDNWNWESNWDSVVKPVMVGN